MEMTSWSPLIWLLVLAGPAVAMVFSLVDRPAGLKWGAFLLRVLGFILLCLAMCRPHTHREGDLLHVVFIVDVSESVDLALVGNCLSEIEAAIDGLRPGDSWSLFSAANGVRPHGSVEELKKIMTAWREGIADDAFRSQSRLSDALLNCRLAFPSGKAGRMVLFSDGQETGGDTASALAVLARERVDVQFFPVEGLQKAEASLVSAEPAANLAYQGETVRMRVTAAANQAMAARLRLLHKGVAIKEESVRLAARVDNLFELDVEMTTPGPSVWTAELLPEQDYFPVNNQLSATVMVKGKPRLLILHRDPAAMRPFSRLLKEQGFEADVRGQNGLPDAIEEMLAFDAIVLADVPATDLSFRQMELLRKYVTDFGGGLAMFGSDNSFGLGGYYKTPVEEALPLVSRYEKEKEKPSLAMVLVIDKSGSMEGQPIELARQAAKATVELLGNQDKIAVVGFDSEAQVVCEMRSAAERDSVLAAIDSLAAGGGTDVFPAMQTAREMLDSSGSKIKHMIILSDGQTAPADHLGLTQAMADSGITVSTVALGDGAARDLMLSIAETGKGRYYETADPSTVPQIFTKETLQVSHSAIKEDLFGSVQVGDHPMLAGYEGADLPFCLGYVMTEAKPASRVLLAAETGDPLLAVGRVGLGTGLAWTSDLSEKWGGEWLAWDGCGKFWAQVFRGILRKSDTEGLTTRTQVLPGNRWQIEIERNDPNQMPVSGIAWEATAIDENGRTIPVEVEETGLGKYRTVIPLEDSRQLTVRLRDRDADKLKTLSYAAPYPREYQLSRGLPAALASLSRFNPALVRENVAKSRRHASAAHWFVFAGMGALLAGLVLRRI